MLAIVGLTTYINEIGPGFDGVIEEDMQPVTETVMSVRALFPIIVAEFGIDTTHE